MAPPLTLFQQLIGARSVWGEEHSAIAIVERALAGLGVFVARVPFSVETLARTPGAQPPFCAVPGRHNLVARIPGQGNGRSLILNCHLDIVPEGDATTWTMPPFEGLCRDGLIYGRGALDDKAGVMICLALLERFVRQPLAGDVIVQFVLEDETTGNGSLLCLESGSVADAAIIVDGTHGDRGINQHAGNARFGVTVFGAPASVSVSHMGVNAAELLAQLLLEIREAVFHLNGHNVAPWTQYPSPNQMAVVSLTCPETLLTVPAAASAVCHATFVPPLSLSGFRDRLAEMVQGFAHRHDLRRVPHLDWDHFATEPVHSHATDLEAVLQQACGRAVPFGPSTGTSDLRHFAARAIPCVLFGPGRGRNPHRADECFELQSLSETTEILARAVTAWCG